MRLCVILVALLITVACQILICTPTNIYYNTSNSACFAIDGNDYVPNLNCTVTLFWPDAAKVWQISLDLALSSPSSDHVALYNGPTATGQPFEILYGGTTGNTFSQSNAVTVSFYTDALPKMSSSFSFTAAVSDPIVHCSGLTTVLSASSTPAVLSEPATFGAAPYLPNVVCGWRINAGPGQRVMVTPTTLNSRRLAAGDSLRFFDGSDANAPELPFSLNGAFPTELTMSWFSTGSSIYALFTSVASPKLTMTGFSVSYSTFTGTTQCLPSTLIDASNVTEGSIQAPLYGIHAPSGRNPLYRYAYQANRTCTWTITAAVGSIVHLSYDCLSRGGPDGIFQLAPDDVINAYDGSSAAAPLLIQWSRTNDPGNRNTECFSTGRTVFVEFMSSPQSVGNIGFLLNWAAMGVSQCLNRELVVAASTTQEPFSVPSPFFLEGPTHYSGPATCVFVFEAPIGATVLFSTSQYDLAAGDSITFFDVTAGANVSIAQLVGSSGETFNYYGVARAASTGRWLKAVMVSTHVNSLRNGILGTYTAITGSTQCSGTLAVGNSSFAAPASASASSVYAVGTTCVWQVEVAANRVAQVRLAFWDISPWHSLRFYNGSTLLGTLTGTSLSDDQRDTITSIGNTMTVVFDTTNATQGYRAGFSATVQDIAPAVDCPAPNTVIDNYASPFYWPRVAPGSVCQWRYEPRNAPWQIGTLDITFIESPANRLTLYDGTTTSAPIVAQCQGGACTNMDLTSVLQVVGFAPIGLIVWETFAIGRPNGLSGLSLSSTAGGVYEACSATSTVVATLNSYRYLYPSLVNFCPYIYGSYYIPAFPLRSVPAYQRNQLCEWHVTTRSPLLLAVQVFGDSYSRRLLTLQSGTKLLRYDDIGAFGSTTLFLTGDLVVRFNATNNQLIAPGPSVSVVARALPKFCSGVRTVHATYSTRVISYKLAPCTEYQHVEQRQRPGDAPVQGCCGQRYPSRGGRLRSMFWYDLLTFLIALGCVAAAMFVGDSSIYTTKKWSLNWRLKAVLFYCKVLYGFLSVPFIFFKIPVLFTFLTHAKPTAYNRTGMTVPPNYPSCDDIPAQPRSGKTNIA